MKIQAVQLVIPKAIKPTYSSEQQKEILHLEDFITMVKKKQ
jgi:hypothetical protein